MLYLCSTCQTFSHLILPISKLYVFFMHDFVNNLTPPKISELTSYSSEKYHYYTRSSAAGNLYLKHLRTEHMKNSLSRLGARIWNSTPICLCSLLKCKFKRLLHRQLLNILMRENTNVDVHTLIDKFRKFINLNKKFHFLFLLFFSFWCVIFIPVVICNA